MLKNTSQNWKDIHIADIPKLSAIRISKKGGNIK